MKKKFALTLVSLASVALLAACGEVSTTGNSGSASGTEIGKTLKIGFNFEETGDVASYGTAEQKGAKLAVDEINKAGGVDGKQIEVTDKDNKSELSEASTVSTNLVTQAKVNTIIGPATSGGTGAAITNAAKASVPLITPSGTQDDLTKGQDYLFRTTFIDSFQGKILSKYVTDNLKAKKVVLYYDNSSDYAKGIAKAFQEEYKGEIVATETFASKDTDFQAALTKFKGKDFDALVVPGYYTEAGKIVNQARGIGIDKPIVGGDGFNSEEFISQATPAAATNVYYVSGYSTSGDMTAKAKKFLEAYKAKYNEEPSMFSALAYDSVYMVAEASKGAKNSVDIKENLAKLKDFEGVTGSITMDKNHNPVKSALMIGLKDGKVDTVETVKPN
ncbi:MULTISPECIES: ABC transporter substrate-binding protein [Streptococcus]|jgi:branched-chain amino acid ABC transporter, amino acid-binding protein|uniref:ABC transporter substrate-binding protein n=1 Tax=Streptococcus gordonii TaxID=1302 RepID=A0AB35FWR8_STRGN|nr:MULTISPECIES: ABC transporter substrate-binding protein [Streptococcus]ATF64953.1 branched-chain amino acid ABC transporter substrate-binding protein [Streptococcus gordonii]MBN2958559.1 ABC transporter substrate-binding protein [Streptococcus gordonii]MBZ2128333.1 ABC transporter substrate-binding protein [Streptococcus gordonii]MBZ2130339.1 ABC transporter substrate-binding protein [Streptococcus gordonii]MBZ2139232.1 ABC transporter substrate-binding protein [Streptococcus gordonii]